MKKNSKPVPEIGKIQPSITLDWNRESKKKPPDILDDLSVEDKVCVVAMGSVRRISKDEYGSSLSVNIDKSEVYSAEDKPMSMKDAMNDAVGKRKM